VGVSWAIPTYFEPIYSFLEELYSDIFLSKEKKLKENNKKEVDRQTLVTEKPSSEKKKLKENDKDDIRNQRAVTNKVSSEKTNSKEKDKENIRNQSIVTKSVNNSDMKSCCFPCFNNDIFLDNMSAKSFNNPQLFVPPSFSIQSVPMPERLSTLYRSALCTVNGSKKWIEIKGSTLYIYDIASPLKESDIKSLESESHCNKRPKLSHRNTSLLGESLEVLRPSGIILLNSSLEIAMHNRRNTLFMITEKINLPTTLTKKQYEMKYIIEMDKEHQVAQWMDVISWIAGTNSMNLPPMLSQEQEQQQQLINTSNLNLLQLNKKNKKIRIDSVKNPQIHATYYNSDTNIHYGPIFVSFDNSKTDNTSKSNILNWQKVFILLKCNGHLCIFDPEYLLSLIGKEMKRRKESDTQNGKEKETTDQTGINSIDQLLDQIQRGENEALYQQKIIDLSKGSDYILELDRARHSVPTVTFNPLGNDNASTVENSFEYQFVLRNSRIPSLYYTFGTESKEDYYTWISVLQGNLDKNSSSVSTSSSSPSSLKQIALHEKLNITESDTLHNYLSFTSQLEILDEVDINTTRQEILKYLELKLPLKLDSESMAKLDYKLVKTSNENLYQSNVLYCANTSNDNGHQISTKLYLLYKGNCLVTKESIDGCDNNIANASIFMNPANATFLGVDALAFGLPYYTDTVREILPAQDQQTGSLMANTDDSISSRAIFIEINVRTSEANKLLGFTLIKEFLIEYNSQVTENLQNSQIEQEARFSANQLKKENKGSSSSDTDVMKRIKRNSARRTSFSPRSRSNTASNPNEGSNNLSNGISLDNVDLKLSPQIIEEKEDNLYVPSIEAVTSMTVRKFNDGIHENEWTIYLVPHMHNMAMCDRRERVCTAEGKVREYEVLELRHVNDIPHFDVNPNENADGSGVSGVSTSNGAKDKCPQWQHRKKYEDDLKDYQGPRGHWIRKRVNQMEDKPSSEGGGKPLKTKEETVEIIPFSETTTYTTHAMTKDDIGCIIDYEYHTSNETVLLEEAKGPCESAPPRIRDFYLEPEDGLQTPGSVAPGKKIKIHCKYMGGWEGNSKIAWMRVRQGAREEIPDTEAHLDYTLKEDDIGCTFKVKYTPIRKVDGDKGEVFTSKMFQAKRN